MPFRKKTLKERMEQFREDLKVVKHLPGQTHMAELEAGGRQAPPSSPQLPPGCPPGHRPATLPSRLPVTPYM